MWRAGRTLCNVPLGGGTPAQIAAASQMGGAHAAHAMHHEGAMGGGAMGSAVPGMHAMPAAQTVISGLQAAPGSAGPFGTPSPGSMHEALTGANIGSNAHTLGIGMPVSGMPGGQQQQQQQQGSQRGSQLNVGSSTGAPSPMSPFVRQVRTVRGRAAQLALRTLNALERGETVTHEVSNAQAAAETIVGMAQVTSLLAPLSRLKLYPLRGAFFVPRIDEAASKRCVFDVMAGATGVEYLNAATICTGTEDITVRMSTANEWICQPLDLSTIVLSADMIESTLAENIEASDVGRFRMIAECDKRVDLFAATSAVVRGMCRFASLPRNQGLIACRVGFQKRGDLVVDLVRGGAWV